MWSNAKTIESNDQTVGTSGDWRGIRLVIIATGGNYLVCRINAAELRNLSYKFSSFNRAIF